PEQSRAGVALRSECRTDRGARPGGLRHDRVRSAVRFELRRHALCLAAVDHADHACCARPAVLAGVPRRAGPGGCAATDRVRLRGGLAAPHSAAALRAAEISVARMEREARNAGCCSRIAALRASIRATDHSQVLTISPRVSPRTTPAPPPPRRTGA